jgi:N-methylhydantoinase A
MNGVLIGIDTGGTFTDVVLCDLSTNDYTYFKLPTSTGNPSQAVLDGIKGILELAKLPSDQVTFLVLGTTLGTNAVLEGKCSNTGMITTAGFSDILELARQRKPHVFNLDLLKPTPVVKRDCRLEVDERIDFMGTQVRALDEKQVKEAINVLKLKNVEAVAICMMHSYANPIHEKRTAEILQEIWPTAYVCVSSEIMPEFREFERFSTTAVNASLMPIMDRYLDEFEKGVSNLGIKINPRVMQSNGGAVTPKAVRLAPVNTFFSGPSGGVIGAIGLGAKLGINDLITFDMGGTSTDVCLIKNGTPVKKDLREIAGFPVRTRTIDIHTIGAGGGSIAWVDAGGLLKVGPMSAGAYPGPIAYGRGGERPTVTDANVILGRLNPHFILGGEMKIYPELVKNIIDKDLAPLLHVDLEKACAGILEIINVNMMGAVRVISIEQGIDARDFTLVAFGGAGPLHAADVAFNMGIPHVLIPPRPGLLSAIGLLHADICGDFSLTKLVQADERCIDVINQALLDLKARGLVWLENEVGIHSDAQMIWSIDLRYQGQNSELSLPVDESQINLNTLHQLIENFHQSHTDFYGYSMKDQVIEIVNLRLMVRVLRPAPPIENIQNKNTDLKIAIVENRLVWFFDYGYVQTKIYDRDLLPINSEFDGPAIIEQMDTTTVVPPQFRVKNDEFGFLHLYLKNT